MNFRRLLAVARKETLHIRRDPRSLILAVGIPMLMLLMFGYALTLEAGRIENDIERETAALRHHEAALERMEAHGGPAAN